MAEIRVWQGDITRLEVDAIVNAANEGLAGGSGVNGAIRRAAGPGLEEECARLGGCATGDAKMTGGHALPVRHVIHAVGPVWQGGGQGEPESLASCYRRAVELADAAGCRSLAFPALSTGIFGYPPEAAARVAVGTLREALPGTGLEQVLLVAFDAGTAATLEAALEDAT